MCEQLLNSWEYNCILIKTKTHYLDFGMCVWGNFNSLVFLDFSIVHSLYKRVNCTAKMVLDLNVHIA